VTQDHWQTMDLTWKDGWMEASRTSKRDKLEEAKAWNIGGAEEDE